VSALGLLLCHSPRHGERECTGAATMPQSSTLRLILNAVLGRRESDLALQTVEFKNAGSVCSLLQYLLQSCSRVCGGETMEDMCLERLPASTSRGLCGLVCPSRTSERGGEGYCVKGGGGE
jgi:hypothetical protein